MAKLPENVYTIIIENSEYVVSEGFAESLSALLREGETSSGVVLTTKTAIQNEKMELTNENKRLKEELEFVRDDNTEFEEEVKELNNEKRKLEAELKATKNELMEMTVKRDRLWNERLKLIQRAAHWRNEYDILTVDLEESQRNNVELSADVKALEVRLQEANKKLVNATYGKKQMEWDALLEENEKLKKKLSVAIELRKEISHDWCELDVTCMALTKERDDLQKQNDYLSGLVEMLRKENKELKEQLEASSDLNMTNELACIMGEYVDGNQKNHNILVDKLAKFQEKHKLICVAGELKRG